jgi:hypothetical protein
MIYLRLINFLLLSLLIFSISSSSLGKLLNNKQSLTTIPACKSQDFFSPLKYNQEFSSPCFNEMQVFSCIVKDGFTSQYVKKCTSSITTIPACKSQDFFSPLKYNQEFSSPCFNGMQVYSCIVKDGFTSQYVKKC